jgi:hypothetical protein
MSRTLPWHHGGLRIDGKSRSIARIIPRKDIRKTFAEGNHTTTSVNNGMRVSQ